MTTDSRAVNAGATLLRVALGAMWVSHAWFKITAFGVAGFAGWLDSLGLPGFMAGPVIALELVGGALIVASAVHALIGDGALALKSRPLPFAALRAAQG